MGPLQIGDQDFRDTHFEHMYQVNDLRRCMETTGRFFCHPAHALS